MQLTSKISKEPVLNYGVYSKTEARSQRIRFWGACAAVERFNAQYPIGTPVQVIMSDGEVITGVISHGATVVGEMDALGYFTNETGDSFARSIRGENFTKC